MYSGRIPAGWFRRPGRFYIWRCDIGPWRLLAWLWGWRWQLWFRSWRRRGYCCICRCRWEYADCNSGRIDRNSRWNRIITKLWVRWDRLLYPAHTRWIKCRMFWIYLRLYRSGRKQLQCRCQPGWWQLWISRSFLHTGWCICRWGSK